MRVLSTILADFRSDADDLFGAWEQDKISDKKAIEMLINLCLSLLRDTLEFVLKKK